MKKITFLFLLLLSSPGLWGQVEETKPGSFEKSAANINNIANLNALGPMGVGFDDRYEGIKGSPMRFDDWVNGDVYLTNNSLVKNLMLNLNLYDRSLCYRLPGSEQVMAISNEKVREIHVPESGQILVFRRFDPRQFLTPVKPDHLFEILGLFQGEYIFAKLSKKVFKKADYKGAYSSDRRYDEFVLRTDYYLTNREGKFEKIRLKKRSIMKLFPDQKARIKAIVKNNHLTAGEEMVIKVLQELSL